MMYSLDEEVMFYILNDDYIKRYDDLAKNNIINLIPLVPLQFKNINYHITIFNIWCALLAKRELLFLNEQKRMDYSVIFFQLEYVEHNVNLQKYIERSNLTDDEHYKLAFFVSMEMMLWIENVMQSNDEQYLVDYFKNEQNLRAKETPEKQTPFMKNITANINGKNDLYLAIQRAISRTEKSRVLVQ